MEAWLRVHGSNMRVEAAATRCAVEQCECSEKKKQLRAFYSCAQLQSVPPSFTLQTRFACWFCSAWLAGPLFFPALLIDCFSRAPSRSTLPSSPCRTFTRALRPARPALAWTAAASKRVDPTLHCQCQFRCLCGVQQLHRMPCPALRLRPLATARTTRCPAQPLRRRLPAVPRPWRPRLHAAHAQCHITLCCPAAPRTLRLRHALAALPRDARRRQRRCATRSVHNQRHCQRHAALQHHACAALHRV